MQLKFWGGARWSHIYNARSEWLWLLHAYIQLEWKWAWDVMERSHGGGGVARFDG